MRHFLDRATFDGSGSPWAGAGVARSLSVFEALRGVFPDQDRIKKTGEDTTTVGNDLPAVKELCASVRPTSARSALPTICFGHIDRSSAGLFSPPGGQATVASLCAATRHAHRPQ